MAILETPHVSIPTRQMKPVTTQPDSAERKARAAQNPIIANSYDINFSTAGSTEPIIENESSDDAATTLEEESRAYYSPRDEPQRTAGEEIQGDIDTSRTIGAEAMRGDSNLRVSTPDNVSTTSVDATNSRAEDIGRDAMTDAGNLDSETQHLTDPTLMQKAQAAVGMGPLAPTESNTDSHAETIGRDAMTNVGTLDSETQHLTDPTLIQKAQAAVGMGPLAPTGSNTDTHAESIGRDAMRDEGNLDSETQHLTNPTLMQKAQAAVGMGPLAPTGSNTDSHAESIGRDAMRDEGKLDSETQHITDPTLMQKAMNMVPALPSLSALTGTSTDADGDHTPESREIPSTADTVSIQSDREPTSMANVRACNEASVDDQSAGSPVLDTRPDLAVESKGVSRTMGVIDSPKNSRVFEETFETPPPTRAATSQTNSQAEQIGREAIEGEGQLDAATKHLTEPSMTQKAMASVGYGPLSNSEHPTIVQQAQAAVGLAPAKAESRSEQIGREAVEGEGRLDAATKHLTEPTMAQNALASLGYGPLSNSEHPTVVQQAQAAVGLAPAKPETRSEQIGREAVEGEGRLDAATKHLTEPTMTQNAMASLGYGPLSNSEHPTIVQQAQAAVGLAPAKPETRSEQIGREAVEGEGRLDAATKHLTEPTMTQNALASLGYGPLANSDRPTLVQQAQAAVGLAPAKPETRAEEIGREAIEGEGRLDAATKDLETSNQPSLMQQALDMVTGGSNPDNATILDINEEVKQSDPAVCIARDATRGDSDVDAALHKSEPSMVEKAQGAVLGALAGAGVVGNNDDTGLNPDYDNVVARDDPMQREVKGMVVEKPVVVPEVHEKPSKMQKMKNKVLGRGHSSASSSDETLPTHTPKHVTIVAPAPGPYNADRLDKSANTTTTNPQAHGTKDVSTPYDHERELVSKDANRIKADGFGVDTSGQIEDHQSHPSDIQKAVDTMAGDGEEDKNNNGLLAGAMGLLAGAGLVSASNGSDSNTNNTSSSTSNNTTNIFSSSNGNNLSSGSKREAVKEKLPGTSNSSNDGYMAKAAGAVGYKSTSDSQDLGIVDRLAGALGYEAVGDSKSSRMKEKLPGTDGSKDTSMKEKIPGMGNSTSNDDTSNSRSLKDKIKDKFSSNSGDDNGHNNDTNDQNKDANARDEELIRERQLDRTVVNKKDGHRIAGDGFGVETSVRPEDTSHPSDIQRAVDTMAGDTPNDEKEPGVVEKVVAMVAGDGSNNNNNTNNNDTNEPGMVDKMVAMVTGDETNDNNATKNSSQSDGILSGLTGNSNATDTNTRTAGSHRPIAADSLSSVSSVSSVSSSDSISAPKKIAPLSGVSDREVAHASTLSHGTVAKRRPSNVAQRAMALAGGRAAEGVQNPQVLTSTNVSFKDDIPIAVHGDSDPTAYIKNTDLLTQARKTQPLSPLLPIQESDVLPMTKGLTKIMLRANKDIAKAELRAAKQAKNEEKRRNDDIATFEKRLNKDISYFGKSMYQDDETTDAQGNRRPLEEFELEAKRMKWPLISEYDRAISQSHLDNMKLIYRCRLLGCVSAYEKMHAGEWAELNVIEDDEWHALDKDYHSNVKSVDKDLNWGVTNKLTGTKTVDGVKLHKEEVKEAAEEKKKIVNIQQEARGAELRVEHERRRAALSTAQEQRVSDLVKTQTQLMNTMHVHDLTM